MKEDTQIISLPTALFITFLVLKLTQVIDWSWWWVTAPLWIPLAAMIVILLIVVFVALVAAAFGAADE